MITAGHGYDKSEFTGSYIGGLQRLNLRLSSWLMDNFSHLYFPHFPSTCSIYNPRTQNGLIHSIIWTGSLDMIKKIG